MYQNVSEYYGDAVAGPNRSFNLKLTENGIDIVGSLKSVQITSGSEEITIGSAISSYLDATIEKQEITLSGREVILQAGIEINGTYEYIPMGAYTIQNPRVQGNTISFTAYDRLTSRCNGGYFSKITYPIDALDVLSEIESMTGITIDKTGLARGIQIQKRAVINEDVDSEEDTVITTYVNPFDGYTYKEALGFIAGLYGKFAICGRTGNIEFRWYTETGYTITADTFYDDFEESEEGFALGRLECDTADQTLVSGTGTTGISFSNPVMTQGTLDDAFSKVRDLSFVPGMVRFIGDPRLDPWDIVTVIKNDGTEFKVPAVHLLTAYDGGLMQSITSAGNTESEDDADSKGPVTEMVERVSYDLAFIKTLMVDNFTATNGTVKNLNGDFLSFKAGEFETLKAQQAAFENLTAENFTAVRAEIDNILIGNLDADYARIDFANIDTAKIKQGFMENLMVSQGIFTSDITAAEGTFTNYLTGVNILANNITAGTLSVERLIITGSDKSIVYEINKANGTPQLSQSTMDGGALTERTVKADRIVAESITGNEIAATTITGQHIVANSITAMSLDVNSIFAQDITATGTITGINLVGATGSFSGNITAGTGTIGPWNIGNSSIWKGNSSFATATGMYFGNDGLSITDKFKVSSAGIMTATNGSFTGNITANQMIVKNKLVMTNGDLSISASALTASLSTRGRALYINMDNQFDTVGVGGSLKAAGSVVVDGEMSVSSNVTCNDVIANGWAYVGQLRFKQNSSGNYISIGNYNNAWNNYYYAPGYHAFYCNGNGVAYIQSNGIKMNNYDIMFNLGHGVKYGESEWILRGYTSGSYNVTALGNGNRRTVLYGSQVRLSSSTGTTVTSDRRLKKDFSDFDERYEKFFMNLKPQTYKMAYEKNADEYKRTNGFIAQDVEKALLEANITPEDLDLISCDTADKEFLDEMFNGHPPDIEKQYSLNYNNFISLNTYMIQKNRTELEYHAGCIDLQQAAINDLQNRLWQVEKKIKQLKQADQ